MEGRLPPPTLRTTRLLLRPFSRADAEQVQRLCNDPAIFDTTLNIPYPYRRSMAEDWIASHAGRFAAGEDVTFAIVLLQTQLLIGAIALEINRDHDRAEIGYWIGRDFWGRGYGSEAASEVLRYGFEDLCLHKVVGHHFARNAASGRVMEKIGMRKEGYLRDEVRKGNHYEDLVAWAILREEWQVRATGIVDGACQESAHSEGAPWHSHRSVKP